MYCVNNVPSTKLDASIEHGIQNPNEVQSKLVHPHTNFLLSPVWFNI